MCVEQRLLPAICALLFLVLVPACSATELPKQDYIYRQDFESEEPIIAGSAVQNCVVNFKGITSERKIGGEKSFKLDITFTKDATVV
jgi:hypothetical protein